MKRLFKIVLAIVTFAVLAIAANVIISGLTALFGMIAIAFSVAYTIAFYAFCTYVSFKIIGLFVEIAIFKKLMSK